MSAADGFDSRNDALFARDHRGVGGGVRVFDSCANILPFAQVLSLAVSPLDEVLSRIKSRTVDIFFAFEQLTARLRRRGSPRIIRSSAAARPSIVEKIPPSAFRESRQH